MITTFGVPSSPNEYQMELVKSEATLHDLFVE
jgi:hypothetical protein